MTTQIQYYVAALSDPRNQKHLACINNALGCLLKVSAPKHIEEIEINSVAEAYYWLNIILTNDSYRTDTNYSLLLQHVLRKLWNFCGDLEKYALLPIYFYLLGITHEIQSSSITDEEIIETLSNSLQTNSTEIIRILALNIRMTKQ